MIQNPSKLSKALTLSVLITLCVLGAFSVSHADTAQVPEAEIEHAIRAQLNSVFDLQEWSHRLIDETQKGPVTFSQLTLAMKAKLNEPLYRRAGRNPDGKTFIEISKAKGSVIDLEDKAMVISMGGLGKDQIQVMLGPSPQGKAGSLLSVFPKNSYVMAKAKPKPEASQPVNPDIKRRRHRILFSNF